VALVYHYTRKQLIDERNGVAQSLKISEAASIAMHALILLANQPDEPMNNNVIASTFGISANHSSKVMQRLLKQGFVYAKRGPGGGYLLAVKPSSVTLLEVYVAIDGNTEASSCLFGQSKFCSLTNCLFRKLTQEADALIEKHLGAVTLADYANIEFNVTVPITNNRENNRTQTKQIQRKL